MPELNLNWKLDPRPSNKFCARSVPTKFMLEISSVTYELTTGLHPSNNTSWVLFITVKWSKNLEFEKIKLRDFQGIFWPFISTPNLKRKMVVPGFFDPATNRPTWSKNVKKLQFYNSTPTKINTKKSIRLKRRLQQIQLASDFESFEK